MKKMITYILGKFFRLPNILQFIEIYENYQYITDIDRINRLMNK